jgi:hypothetical protein
MGSLHEQRVSAQGGTPRLRLQHRAAHWETRKAVRVHRKGPPFARGQAVGPCEWLAASQSHAVSTPAGRTRRPRVVRRNDRLREGRRWAPKLAVSFRLSGHPRAAVERRGHRVRRASSLRHTARGSGFGGRAIRRARRFAGVGLYPRPCRDSMTVVGQACRMCARGRSLRGDDRTNVARRRVSPPRARQALARKPRMARRAPARRPSSFRPASTFPVPGAKPRAASREDR